MSTVSSQGSNYRPLNTLRDVVTEYLNTQAYAFTARALARPRVWKRASATATPITADMADDDGEADNNIAEGSGEGSEGVDASGDVAMGGDADGEAVEETDCGGFLSAKELIAMERRRAILDYILNGALLRAVDLLNTHFPSVLAESDGSAPVDTAGTHTASMTGSGRRGQTQPSPGSGSVAGMPRPHPVGYPHMSFSAFQPSSSFAHAPALNIPPPPPMTEAHAMPTLPQSLLPAHVHLNLSIQAFIELVRQLNPASVPSSPSSSIGSLSSSMHLPSASGVALTNALSCLQGLHQQAKKLLPADRALYLKELNDVNGLLAYTSPETSIVRGFLEQSRRIVLAEQVNKAILYSQGRATYSKLEETARKVTAMWATMMERNIDSTPTWTAADGASKEELAMYLKSHTGRTFNLREFIGRSSS